MTLKQYRAKDIDTIHTYMKRCLRTIKGAIPTNESFVINELLFELIILSRYQEISISELVEWLDSPNDLFDYKSPAEIINEDPQALLIYVLKEKIKYDI